MHLFQFMFGIQPHYAVAKNYGEAEQLIVDSGYGTPEKIEDLGPYILLPKATATDDAEAADE